MLRIKLNSFFIIITILFSSQIDRYEILKLEANNSNYNSYKSFSYHSNIFQSDRIFSFKYSYQNNAIDYSNKFYDNNNFLLRYHNEFDINKNLKFYLSAFAENQKTNPISFNANYWYENFAGISGDIDNAYLEFHQNNIFIKVGKDYFSPGIYLRDRILFSNNGYPYEQVILSYRSSNISITSFYLSLSNLGSDSSLNPYDNIIRHINGHRLSFNFENGYFALNEIVLYGGVNQPINFDLFNPFGFYYLYQHSEDFQSNCILSIEFLINQWGFDFFGELVVDDFQVDKKEPSDLEPAEYAIMIDVNKEIYKNLNLSFNYTKVANRTFNSQFFSHEKFINKNFPIGHILGNNFWKYHYSIKYFNSKFIYHLSFFYINSGEEALYSDFNTDYLNHNVNDGYTEQFPFGELASSNGLILDLGYYISSNKFIGCAASYIIDSAYMNKGLNFTALIKISI